MRALQAPTIATRAPAAESNRFHLSVLGSVRPPPTGIHAHMDLAIRGNHERFWSKTGPVLDTCRSPSVASCFGQSGQVYEKQAYFSEHPAALDGGRTESVAGSASSGQARGIGLPVVHREAGAASMQTCVSTQS